MFSRPAITALASLCMTAFSLAAACGNDASDAVQAADAGDSSDASSTCAECADGVCNPASGACVECLRAEHCAADRPVCEENACTTCASSDPRCIEAPVDPDPADAGPPPSEAGVVDGAVASTPLDIRLASYNVRTSNLDNGAWGDTHVGWDANDDARMVRVADTIASQKLTVVSAQEMRKPERDAVLSRLEGKHGQKWGFTTLKEGADDSVVLFRRSVWSLVREVHFVVPLQPGLGDRNQVGALLRHEATGREVWVYSVHFASGDSAAAAAARVEAAKRTLASIEGEAVAKKQPFILAGDFNSTADEGAGDVLRASGLMKYTRNVADARVNDGCKSFNGRAGSEGLQVCFGGVASHIDQVWVPKNGMQVLKYQITATAQTSRASDHNPLTTILRQP